MSENFLEKVKFLELRYNKFLSFINIQEQAIADYSNYFGLDEEDRYENPFYESYKTEDLIKNIRDNIISTVIRIFNKKYPNVYLCSKDFEECVSKDKHGNLELEIDFNKINLKIDDFEKRSDEFALKNLVKHSIKLIPYKLLKDENWKYRKFKKEEIVKNNKLILYSGWSYSSPNTEHTSYLLKLISVVLDNAKPSIAEENKAVHFKYYKNGRMDITFEDSKKAELVAELLEKNQEEE